MTVSTGWRHPKWWHALLYAFLLIAPATAVFLGSDAGATILAAVGTASLILTRLPDVVSFSGFGMSAQLDKKIKEADKVIADLKSISLAFAQASLDEMARSGQHFGDLNTSHRFANRAKIVKSLEDIGATPDDILKAQNGWIELNSFLLLHVIAERAAETRHDDQEAIQSEIKGLRKDARLGLPTPAALRDWAARSNDGQLISLSDEYRRLQKTGGLENPDIIPFDLELSDSWLGEPTIFSSYPQR